MNFSQWFWKYGYFIVPLILALAWFLSSEKFQKQDDVNPAIFEFFNSIDQQCKNEAFDERSSKCLEIEQYKKDCQKISATCDSKTYYDLLKKLDFVGPAYYLPAP